MIYTELRNAVAAESLVVHYACSSLLQLHNAQCRKCSTINYYETISAVHSRHTTDIQTLILNQMRLQAILYCDASLATALAQLQQLRISIDHSHMYWMLYPIGLDK